MTTVHKLLALAPAAYLLGSVPFGLMIGLARGVDPRKAGSGNIGATNVGRLLGGRFFALVFALDLFKGLLPTLAASWVVHRAGATNASAAVHAAWLLVGLAAILGHMFSVFLGFRGGKGVATSAGVMLGIWPYFTLAALGALAAFGIAFAVWRIVSLGSMIGAASFPLSLLAFGAVMDWRVLGRQRWPLMAFAVVVAVLVIYKHRGNIARLRAGTEGAVGSK